MYNQQVRVKKVSSVRVDRVQGSSKTGGSYGKISVGGYASSVYAGAGGLGTKISTSVQHGAYRSDNIQIYGNEKETMQILNNRLSIYLEKVRSLEKANAQLEQQINDWYKNNVTKGRDDSPYFQTIEDLQVKILNAKMENATILLQLDNSKLAADDFKIKFENEQTFRASTENDIYELRKVIDQLTIIKADLESQFENLNEELVILKKNHAEEMDELLKKVHGNIEVELDATPSVNLAQIMEDMRAQYAKLVEEQRAEAKYWFETKVTEWNEEVRISTTDLQGSKKEVVELNKKKQELEIEAQTELSKKNALASTLENVISQWSIELTEVQDSITNLETHLTQTRKDVTEQIFEFGLLLDLKNRLESEIATYRSLLDGGEASFSSNS